MTPVAEILRDEIRRSGPISFHRFMDAALYHPEFGYYRRPRDPFGTRDDVAGYRLSPQIRIEWIPDGDHSLKPRAKSGTTERQNLLTAIDAAAAFMSSR